MARRRSFSLAFGQGSGPATQDLMIFSTSISGIITSERYYAIGPTGSTGGIATWQDTAGINGIVAVPGTVNNLQVRLSDPSAADNVIVTISINGVDTALTVTLNTGDQIASDTTHSFHITPATRLSWHVTNGDGSATGFIIAALFTPD